MDQIVSVNIAGWLACCFFVVAGFNAASKAWRNLKGKDASPPNEQLEVGRRELERRVAAVESDVSKIRESSGHEREASEAASRTGRAQLYTKIEQVREEMVSSINELRDEVTTQFKDTERALGRIEGKLEK